MGTSAPPRVESPEELEALIKEARERQFRRRFVGTAVLAVVAATAISVWATLPGAGKPHVRQQGTSGQLPLGQHGQSCGVRVVGTRVVNRSGGLLYREPVRQTMGHQVQCSGSDIWVVFFNGVGMSQEGYVGVHSGDGGHTWAPGFSEQPFSGVKAPHQLDSYLGPWTLVGSAAYFSGRCPACGYGTVSWVTKDGGRTFRRYGLPTLTGYAPTSIKVSGNRVTISAKRWIPGRPTHKTAKLRVS